MERIWDSYLGKKFGQSFKDYLNNCRIEQACHLLLRTDKKIYQIAETVGYRDLDYFVNRFISVKGCTPAKFRKQAKTKDEKKGGRRFIRVKFYSLSCIFDILYLSFFQVLIR